MPSKLEPEFGRRASADMPEMEETPAPRAVRIERPTSEGLAVHAPKRPEPVPPRVARIESVAKPEISLATAESYDEDDLEIPAFLRRRAN